MESITSTDKKRPVEEVFGRYLADYCYIAMKSIGIYTMGELLDCDTRTLYEKIEACAKQERLEKHYSEDAYWALRIKIAELGLSFNNDRDLNEINVDLKLAVTLISDLEGLPEHIRHTLNCGYYFFLGSILHATSSEISYKCRHFGRTKLKKLKDYLTSQGLKLYDDVLTLDEVRDIYRSRGVLLLDEMLGIPGRVFGPLFREGIYTMDDLLRFGNSVYALPRMGKENSRELQEALSRCNIHLEGPTEPPFVIELQEEYSGLENKNAVTKDRIRIIRELTTRINKSNADLKALIIKEEVETEKLQAAMEEARILLSQDNVRKIQ